MTAAAETRRFEAEVAQVLHLVTHSLYSHKEIFLRELVSNASDACDKLRFEALEKPELLAEDAELRIEIAHDAEACTVTVRDNGIGMRRDEAIENLGTIARSGTKRFLESLSGDARRDTQLIGQFGVGFYAAFVVAERVVVTTRRAGEPAESGVRWTSEGTGEYTVEPAPDARRGTEVVLHLKADEREFASAWKLRELITRYSDHIAFPIRMRKEGDEEGSETVNHASALWTRPKGEITDADHQAFYRHVAHDFNDALAWAHNRVEGNQSYTTLLYVPEKVPFDAMFGGRDERRGLKLYVRRVFIMDAAEQLLPAYLRFVRGVVDSDDLPLNVSRELLQENRLVGQIRAGIVKRVLDLLERLAKDEAAKFAIFWKAFGGVLKEGIVEDHAHRERIARLLRFPSTRSETAEQLHSLDDYVARMVEGQSAIYYLTADGFLAARHSPAIEALVARGVEVLLLHERVDEWMSSSLSEYAGKPLRNVAKGDLDLGGLAGAVDAAERQVAEREAEPVVARLKALLGERVRDVRVGTRLTESASMIVAAEHEMAPHLARLVRQAGHELPASKPLLEVNPRHPLVAKLPALDEPRAGELALLLLEQAQLAAGAALDDPAGFVRRTNALLKDALGA